MNTPQQTTTASARKRKPEPICDGNHFDDNPPSKPAHTPEQGLVRDYREHFTIDEILVKYQETAAERDRLREHLYAVVDASRELHDATVKELDQAREQVKTLLAACKLAYPHITGRTASETISIGLHIEAAIASAEEKQ